MKMMRALLSCYRVTAMLVKAGTYALLYRFYYGFIFQLHLIEIGAGALIKQLVLPHVSEKRNLALVDGKRLYNVDA